jgi:hypothetical protein
MTPVGTKGDSAAHPGHTEAYAVKHGDDDVELGYQRVETS